MIVCSRCRSHLYRQPDDDRLSPHQGDKHMRGNLFAVAVDLVVLTVRDDRLCVLLTQRPAPPFPGEPGLPGGFVRQREDLLDAATRELVEDTGLTVGRHHLEQLGSYAAPDR